MFYNFLENISESYASDLVIYTFFKNCDLGVSNEITIAAILLFLIIFVCFLNKASKKIQLLSALLIFSSVFFNTIKHVGANGTYSLFFGSFLVVLLLLINFKGNVFFKSYKILLNILQFCSFMLSPTDILRSSAAYSRSVSEYRGSIEAYGPVLRSTSNTSVNHIADIRSMLANPLRSQPAEIVEVIDRGPDVSELELSRTINLVNSVTQATSIAGKLQSGYAGERWLFSKMEYLHAWETVRAQGRENSVGPITADTDFEAVVNSLTSYFDLTSIPNLLKVYYTSIVGETIPFLCMENSLCLVLGATLFYKVVYYQVMLKTGSFTSLLASVIVKVYSRYSSLNTLILNYGYKNKIWISSFFALAGYFSYLKGGPAFAAACRAGVFIAKKSIVVLAKSMNINLIETAFAVYSKVLLKIIKGLLK